MNKRKLKKSAKYTNMIMVLFVILLSVTLAVILVSVLAWKVRSFKKEPIYEYISLGEEAAARAYIWLDQIEDMPLSYTEIRQIMGEIRLTIVLNPTEEKGRYTKSLADGTLADCKNRAQDGLERAYRKVLRYRMLADGQQESISDGEMDELMQETFGVSVSEYLSSCKIQLLPDMEELEAAYLGEVVYE